MFVSEDQVWAGKEAIVLCCSKRSGRSGQYTTGRRQWSCCPTSRQAVDMGDQDAAGCRLGQVVICPGI